MESMLQRLRSELARQGIEFTIEALDEVLQAGAHAASHLGGQILLDPGGDWAFEITLDGENGFSVNIVWWPVEDDEDDDIGFLGFIDPREVN